ncbi:MAG: ATP-binding protein [Crocinitomicaceae bacterium]|jgi:predicted AAA+ superfamily ATPase
MNILFERYRKKLSSAQVSFIRNIFFEIDWTDRLIGLRGPRGIGKTTILLQYLKLHHANDETALYVSLDNIWFSEQNLADFVDDFVKRGGKKLFIDEIHKYPNWAQELKNIYDDFPEVQIVFTGSSLLEILNARADLSRRAVMYSMQGLSFREYLNLEYGFEFSSLTLNEIIKNHGKIASEIVQKIQPIKYFSSYLKTGYYPFFRENPNTYDQRLEEIVNFILEIELPTLRQVDPSYIIKLKQLLLVISSSVPFKPNVTKLAERIGINRNTLISYFHYLEESGLTMQLFKDAKGITRLQKPDKLYLDNTNLLYTIAPQNVQIGHVRETFFANQLAHKHMVEYTDVGDFKINRELTFEIGGKHKTKEQIQGLQNAFIAADDIEIGFQEKIPLWLFGFLY